MTTKPSPEGESPSASSLCLPQLRRSRRGSLASLSSIAKVDKETLAQALDQIHNAACQSEALTTFNEYTSAPLSSSGAEGKSIASELHGGLSGLYNRIKTSVGNAKDVVILLKDDRTIDHVSLESSISALPSPAPMQGNVSDPTKYSKSSNPASNTDARSNSGQQPPLESAAFDAVAKDSGRRTRLSKVSLGSTSTSSKSPLAPDATRKSSLGPLKQATLSTAVSPAVAEVNVIAVKERGLHGDPTAKGVEGSGMVSPELSASLWAEEVGSAGKNRTATLWSNIAEDYQSDAPNLGGSNLDIPKAVHDRAEMASKGSGDHVSTQTSRVARSSRSTTEDGTSSRLSGSESVSNSGNPVLQHLSSASRAIDEIAIPATTNGTQSNTFSDLTTAPHSNSTVELTKHSNHQHLEPPSLKLLVAPHHSNSPPPDLSLSRASSSETAGSASLSSPIPPVSSFLQPAETQANRIGSNPQNRTFVPKQPDSDARTMNVFSQIKSKILNKEYWMKDENARDCFYCGDPFSTFRRKHHCRTCGQIFDAKCTSLLPGAHFGQPGSLRVCKPCEGIINGYDDSSEFSDDGNLSAMGLRPRHGSTGANDVLGSPVPKFSPTSAEEFSRSSKHLDLTVPIMAIPATRKAGGESSKITVETDVARPLLRPSSSRSLKSSLSSRPYSSSHKRHNSRHLNQRGFKTVTEDNAPFHQKPIEGKGNRSRLTAFHDDNIIDPDLAPYLSDEGSSDNEQMSIMAALSGEGLSRSFDSERGGLAGLLASSKKGRSRLGDKSMSGVNFASRDADNNSLSSSRAANHPRMAKRRNVGFGNSMYLRPSPRGYRTSTALPAFSSQLHESSNSSALAQSVSSTNTVAGSRMIRSSSMRGASAPAVELNNASLHHVRKLLRQLLQDANIPSMTNWEKALIPILLQATDDVNPDVQNGEDIDIRHYVKLKKIPGGRPGDTSYVSGLVFTKNLALKSMPRTLSHPNILIITFPLEYARHQQHFMSLEPVIRQEREFLQNLVNRIVALRPQLLLVERNVSGLALEFLEQANIATAYNVKPSVLAAVSRCARTRIISSIDKLAIKPAQAGTCSNFHLKTYVHGGRKKTYMFLSGCTKELGCTVILRGASNATLAKVKRITDFMIYVVYNLKLETCLMRDEFALIPSTTGTGSLFLGGADHVQSQAAGAGPASPTDAAAKASNPLQENGASPNRASSGMWNSEKSGNLRSNTKESGRDSSIPDELSLPDDVPMPTFYGDMVEEHKTKILSASPFVKFMQPYLLMKAREEERRLTYLKRLRDQDILEVQRLDATTEPQKFDLIKPEMIHEEVQATSKKVREVLHALHDAEYDRALHNYQTQSKQWELYIAGNADLFDPYAHQNIAVLYSVVCTLTTVPCSGPDLLALAFYNQHETDEDFEADCTLGQYVEDLCLQANTVCTANGCERKMLDHHRQYVHGEAQLSVFVERYPCKLRGLQDTILVWSCCRICSKETQVMPMSESTWKYSFGKYLELSFWSSGLRARAGICPHDLHRNHLRYFGFKDIALRLHYDPINLLEIIVPRVRITWKVENDLRFKNELFTKIEDRLNRYMTSVKARIKSIRVETVVPEKMDACKQEIEKLSKRASDEHRFLIRKLQEMYMNSKHYEIIPLNRAISITQGKVAEWDNAFADFDHNFFPSEKDIRRLATLQLKKIFLDRDESTTSLTSTDEGSGTSISDDILGEKTPLDITPALPPLTRKLSPEKAHDLLALVVEKNIASSEYTEVGQEHHNQSAPVTSVPTDGPKEIQISIQDLEREDVRHLDLAMSSEFSEVAAHDQKPNLGGSGAVGDPTGENPKLDPRMESHSSFIIAASKSAVNTEALIAESTWKDFAVTEQSKSSGIPRPSEMSFRRNNAIISPPLVRAQTQPAHIRKEKTTSGSHASMRLAQVQDNDRHVRRQGDHVITTVPASLSKVGEKKLSDRVGLGVIKPSSISTHSMIPRSIATRKKDSQVSTLAKHFEQLSREFEKERIRERRLRASKSRQARAYPLAASKPIVEIYRNVREAVEEREPSDEEISATEPSPRTNAESSSTVDMNASTESYTQGDGSRTEDTTAETTETDENNHHESPAGSDVEGEGGPSDGEHSLLDDINVGTENDHHALSPTEAQLDLKLELPKHEKSSLMKMLTNFWAERSASGWQPLDYPLNASAHVFADSDIIVREDEPSSLIAFTLSSEDYCAKLQSIAADAEAFDGGNQKSPYKLESEEQNKVEQALLRPVGTHLKYQFQEGSAKMLCKVFYTEQFDALRRKCGIADRFVESVSRCLKWDSKGGKTKSVFLKTLDDRFVLKSLSPIETQAFLRFAPAYFRFVSEYFFHDLPSCIAKMLGFYQIIIKNPATGVEFNWFLVVMENLFYDRSPTRIFDLKGSMRNRHIQSTGEQNEVLLDENMVEFIYESPLFAREHAKNLLRSTVFNDTLFLQKQNVMDYSLMIAIDENRKELVVGVIDCIRTYTWDKKLESWIKDRGKNRPTVTSPRDYKTRFREAMGRYILQAPNCWHQFGGLQVEYTRLKLQDPEPVPDGEGEDTKAGA